SELVATIAGPGGGAPVVPVELENGPDDGGGEVHYDGHRGVRGQEAGEGEGQAACALAHAQDNDDRRQDEADAVDSQAPLQSSVALVGHGVADEDEDDAGHEGLAHLQQSWGGGHVAGHLARRSCSRLPGPTGVF
uniref:Uncharacterized protein n=1 Tax=Denticeps clupeoides TaxID=299321 RepID=A0AAY4A5M1_9TELE